MNPHPELAPAPNLLRLLGTCGYIGATTLGGGLTAYVHQVFVERERWLSEAQFLESLIIARTVPGPNAVNLVVSLSHRLRGPMGAAAGLLGLVVPAILANMLLVALVLQADTTGPIGGLMMGLGAGAIGLTLANTWMIGRASLDVVVDWVLAIIGFAAVILLELPLIVAVLLFGGAGIAVHWILRRRAKVVGGPQ